MSDRDKDSLKIVLEPNVEYKICTCGKSRDLPYCDGSHRSLSKQEDVELRSLKVTSLVRVELILYSKNWSKKE